MRAASNLYISQPNLSAQINSLENELDALYLKEQIKESN
ncbi:MAG: LysR family transcriptional regulator [Clostridium paraputrificum]